MKAHAQMHTRWAVMISGTGSNLQTLLDEGCEPLPRLVITSRPDAPGVGKARRMGVPVHLLSTPIDWKKLETFLENLGIQKIFLLGFMKIIPTDFIDSKKFQILNLHPSVLPLYPGLKAFEKAYAENSQLGATVHIVEPVVDAGPILKQKKMARLSFPSQARLLLSFVEQSLVREVWSHESF